LYVRYEALTSNRGIPTGQCLDIGDVDSAHLCEVDQSRARLRLR